MKTIRTHCKNGHEFTPENTYRPPGQNKRKCRACAAQRSQRYYDRISAQKKAAKEEQDATFAPQLTEAECAWAAGFFEGEGTVTITSGGREGYTRTRVTLSNTDAETVQFFQERWPGMVLKGRFPTSNSREVHRWELNGSAKITVFLMQLLPYIRTKRVRQKMELVLEANAMRRTGSRDPEYKAQCQKYREAMRALNQRGRQ